MVKSKVTIFYKIHGVKLWKSVYIYDRKHDYTKLMDVLFAIESNDNAEFVRAV